MYEKKQAGLAREDTERFEACQWPKASGTLQERAIDTWGVSGWPLSKARRDEWVVRHSFRAHQTAVSCIAVDESESCMITGCMSGSVRLWNLLEHPVVCSAAYQRHSSAVWAARVLASGATACTAQDTALHFWAMDTARPLSVFAAAASKAKAAEAPFTSVAAVPGSATLGFCSAGMASWSLCQVSASVNGRQLHTLEYRIHAH